MPEIRQSITTPTNFITTTGTDVGSNIGHSTPAQVRTALGIASGFTYDQQAEPSSPTAGQTWRERSSGGVIIGEWEWSGSLWFTSTPSLSVPFETTSFNITAASSTRCIIGVRAVVVEVGFFASRTTGTVDASNSYLVTITYGRGDGVAGSTALGSAQTLNANEISYKSSTLSVLGSNAYNNHAASFTITISAGTPGPVRFSSYALYKRVR
jgi:hypothetical protein